MEKHYEKELAKEPFKRWKRKRYIGEKPDITSAHKQYKDRKPYDDLEFLTEYLAEIETDRDLNKPIQQLLCDVQNSFQDWKEYEKTTDFPESSKKAISLILYSITRMTSMNARVAISNTRLTIAIAIITFL